MTKSDHIRSLAAQGLSVTEVAKSAGVGYQHAYNVLKQNKAAAATRSVASPMPSKPPLRAEILFSSGFHRASGWALDDAGLLTLTDALPKAVGVYAFVKNGLVMYVGVATMGLAKRIYFYAKPGVSQRTSLRLNEIIRGELQSSGHVEVLIAQPDDMEWNGLPVHAAAGLELGLIKKYDLPWNMRSAR